jgi:hypothetical protein
LHFLAKEDVVGSSPIARSTLGACMIKPELRRLLEIAGTLQHHEEEEHKLFGRVCTLMKELEAFCAKLESHFERYKNPEVKKELEDKK